MSSNQSSALGSPQHSYLSFNNPFFTEDLRCFISRPSSFVFTAFYIATILVLLPLIVIILCLAVKEWKQKRSTVSMSHCDCFTYHAVVMEIFGVLRGIPYILGIYTDDLRLVHVGGFLTSFIWYGETAFHVLTCVERYLAIVHPIIYLGLRNERGIRIRNVSIGCVWTFCSLRLGLFMMRETFVIMDFCLLVLSLLVMSFCSLSVLCVLSRPGPGEQGGDRADQSKQRAFYTISTILGVLILRFIASLIFTVLFANRENSDCLVMACIIWFNVPTSLVLPLLFLLRTGSLRGCRIQIT